MSAPTLKCASNAELNRIQSWLVLSNIPFTMIHCDKEIHLGVEGYATLQTMQHGARLFSALEDCCNALEALKAKCDTAQWEIDYSQQADAHSRALAALALIKP